MPRGRLISEMKKILKQGVILLEMLLALAIGSAILTAVSSALVGSQQTNLRSYQNQQAEYCLQEASEAVRSIWLTDWGKIKTNGIFHPEISAGDWALVNGEETLGIYTRWVEIEDVFRDANGSIVASGGILDPSSKRIIVTVTWETPRPGTLSQSFLLTRYHNNTTWIEDVFEDFSDGTEDATDIISNPGYVQLAQTGGGGEWTEPTIINDIDAMAKLNGIWAEGSYLYAALGSSNNKVEVFDIGADPENPLSLGVFATADDVNNIAISGNYLYASLGNSAHEIQVFDIGTDPVDPPEVGRTATDDVPSGLWIQNNYLFASMVGKKLVEVYDLSNPISPNFQGSFETAAATEDITGAGNYLYVANNSTGQAIEVFDTSSSAVAPVSLGTFPAFYSPSGIWIENNTLYVSFKQKRAGMYTLTLNPTRPLLLGIFQTNQNTSDITALGDYGYVAGKDSWQRAIEIVYVGDSKGLSGIYFVYGEYISSTLDAGIQAAFNRISWMGEEPALTNILFQIAVNDDNFSWSFVGSDGTPATYFENPGAIPLDHTLGRYFKYKIILTGDSISTPVVDKVVVNYSL